MIDLIIAVFVKPARGAVLLNPGGKEHQHGKDGDCVDHLVPDDRDSQRDHENG